MIDSHCHIHLDFLNYNGFLNNIDILNIINNAKNEKLQAILNIFEISNNYNFKNIEFISNLNSDNFKIFSAAGVHPLHVKDISIDNAMELLKLNSEKFIAFGETGLDLFKDNNKNEQLEFFEMHCQLSKNYQKPIIIHQRGCDINDIINVLNEFKIKAVFHCWTLGPKELEIVLKNNYLVSFSGIITFDKTMEIVRSAEICPLNMMLLETDTPFLAPKPYRGKPNEPSYVSKVYEYISNLKGVNLEQLKIQIKDNFYNFFNL